VGLRTCPPCAGACRGSPDCWDTPPLDASALRHAPQLRRVIYAGGASDWLLPDGVADIEVSDLGHVNALPVAEYALAAIVFAEQ
jgi:phosphoglycerate dehydrogenase-like enzyme